MIPQKRKIYLIHHTPNREAGDKENYYFGYGECISNFSHGGLYEFRMSNGHTGMFSEEDIIREHQVENTNNRIT